MDVKHCADCGAELPRSAKSCDECGANHARTVAHKIVTLPAPEPSVTSKNTAKPGEPALPVIGARAGFRLVRIAGASVLSCLIGIVGIFCTMLVFRYPEAFTSGKYATSNGIVAAAALVLVAFLPAGIYLWKQKRIGGWLALSAAILFTVLILSDYIYELSRNLCPQFSIADAALMCMLSLPGLGVLVLTASGWKNLEH